jgi:hypothetical protein
MFEDAMFMAGRRAFSASRALQRGDLDIAREVMTAIEGLSVGARARGDDAAVVQARRHALELQAAQERMFEDAMFKADARARLALSAIERGDTDRVREHLNAIKGLAVDAQPR